MTLKQYSASELAAMSLGEKQRVFTAMVAELIRFAYDNGFELTFGDAYRDPRVHAEKGLGGSYSMDNSLHKQRLAIDLNLFRNGVYLTKSEDHRQLGEFWESMGGSWGGRFKDAQGKPSPDGNHYSLEHRGRK